MQYFFEARETGVEAPYGGFALSGIPVIGFECSWLSEGELERLSAKLGTRYIGTLDDISEIEGYDDDEVASQDELLTLMYGVRFEEQQKPVVTDLFDDGDHPVIARYIEAASSMLPDVYPEELQRLLGLMVLANVFSGSVSLYSGNRETPLNLYAMVLGESSTTGKTTSAKLAERMIKLICDKALMPYPRIASNFTAAGLNKSLLECEKGVAFVLKDEADGFFRQVLSRANLQGVAEELTDLYTSDMVYKRATAAPALKHLPNEMRVCLNVLFLGTPFALYSSLNKSQFETGFLHRFCYADLPNPEVDSSTMFRDTGHAVIKDGTMTKVFWDFAAETATSLDWWQKQRMGSALESGRAPIRLSREAMDAANEVTRIVWADIEQSERHKFSAFERFKMNSLKIAGLLCAMDKETFVSRDTMMCALKYAHGYYRTLLSVYTKVGMTRWEMECTLVYEHVAKHPDGVLDSALRQRFGRMHRSYYADVLKTLTDQDRLVRGIDRRWRVKTV
jgi:hypothetical protein